jgi:hypothetical protein
MFRKCKRVLRFGSGATYRPLPEVSVPQAGVDVHWIQKAHEKVLGGILKDTAKLENDIVQRRGKFEYYENISPSREKHPVFEANISSMESTLWQFPKDVINAMCMDTMTLIDNGDIGALKILRATGTKDVRDWITDTYKRRWKRALYRRAVWEYLVREKEERRWPPLKLGEDSARNWLSDRFSDLIQKRPIDPATADFIVVVLFPKRCRLGECAQKFSNHGTPESAEEEELEND